MAVAHPGTGHDWKNCPQCKEDTDRAAAAIRKIFQGEQVYENIWK